jgi:hypothetical protein
VTQYRSVSFYDRFGRLEGQTHYTTHPNQLGVHPNPHYHVRNVAWGEQFIPGTRQITKGWTNNASLPEWFVNPATGTKVFPGEFQP